MLEIYEVYHWSEWRKYDGKDNDSGIFSGYVNSFLALKAEASGWPSHVTTEMEKDQYVKEYFEAEGLVLNKDNVAANSGVRQLSMLALNSL